VAEDVAPEVVEVVEVVEVEEEAGDSDIQRVLLAYKFFYFCENDHYFANFIRMYLYETHCSPNTKFQDNIISIFNRFKCSIH